MRYKSKLFWLRLAGTLLTILLLAWLLHQQGWQQISAALSRITIWHFLVALLVTFLSRVAVALRWHILLRSARAPLSLAQSLKITFAGLFSSNFLPTTIGGDVMRLASAIQMRIDSATGAASLVVDRLMGMAGMALPLPFGLAALFTLGLPPIQTGAHKNEIAGFAASPLFLSRFWNRLRSFFQRTLLNFKLWAHQPGWLLLALGFTLLHQVFLYASILIVLNAMGEPVSWLHVAGIWSLVYFITLLPISVNGLGLQEISTTLLFAHLGGISPETSATVALLVRTLQMTASLPGALFMTGIATARAKKEIQ